MIFVLLLVTATFRPAAPTVGDLITIDFQSPVVLEKSEKYEVVSHEGKRVVVRTFEPRPFELSGRVGDVSFRKLVVPVTSVLQPGDSLEPAALKPPVRPPASKTPLRAIGAAALAAALAWLAVFLMPRYAHERGVQSPPLPAGERFRVTIAELRARSDAPFRWAALADATRRYLAEIEPSLGAELTTSEFVRRLNDTNIRPQDVITTILRQGDLEKFSPWGARPAEFDAVAARALDLIPAPPVAEAA